LCIIFCLLETGREICDEGLIIFPTPPHTIPTPYDEGDEEIVRILPELSCGILELVDDYEHEEVVGEIEESDYPYYPLWISHFSCLEECECESIDMYHREEELLIVDFGRSLVVFSE
jgi:hypothetical protein